MGLDKITIFDSEHYGAFTPSPTQDRGAVAVGDDENQGAGTVQALTFLSAMADELTVSHLR